MQHATPDSLVVLDELGRGTSTFDGYAIAHAVLKHISSKVDCRLLFATHYHPLTTEFASNPGIRLGHMSVLMGEPGMHHRSLLLMHYHPLGMSDHTLFNLTVCDTTDVVYYGPASLLLNLTGCTTFMQNCML